MSKQVKIFSSLLFYVVLSFLYSCTVNTNSIGTDILTEIAIFSEYEKNLMLSQDIVTTTNWNQLFTEKIKDFNPDNSKKISLFINTREDEKMTKLQLRYENGQKPDQYDEMRKVMAVKIEEIKKLYIDNDSFISEATALAKKHVKLMDNGKYEEVFNLMPKEILATFPKDAQNEIISIRERIDFSNRDFRYRHISTNGNPESDKISEVVVYYLLDGKGQHEYIAYHLLDGKTTLVGYTIQEPN